MKNKNNKTEENNKLNSNQKVYLTTNMHKRMSGVKNRIHQFLCFMTIICVLSVSTPAAPALIVERAVVFQQNLLISFKINDWFSLISWKKNKSALQESQEERNARVAKIKIDTDEDSYLTGKKVFLNAVAYDQNDTPVSGIKFDWEVTDENGNSQELIDEIFTPKAPGGYLIKVNGAEKESLRKLIVVDASETNNSDTGKQANLLPYDEWNVDNIPYANNVKNLRGNPPGKPKGKNNFNIAAPVLSIPGRGLNLDLSLYYNSQVWSKLDSDVSYDMDKDWLSPGWNIGFGKIINVINGGIVQVDADGTRRFFAGPLTGANDLITFEGQSTDGSFIKSFSQISVSTNGQCAYNPTTYLKYPNGSTITFDDLDNRSCYGISEPVTMVPKRIQDRFGNRINISYHVQLNNPSGRWINQITDTLGRVYTFNYTLDNGRYYLTSITGQGLPDQNGQIVTRTFVRIEYKNHTITHNFTGLTPHVRESSIKVISAIYYPGTQNGYWFGDADSYSPYGMIQRVDEQRAMGYSSQNGIVQGVLTRRRSYSYPADTSTAITDIPEFRYVTESWEGMPQGTSSTTEYQVNWDASPRTTQTIAADGSTVIEYSYNYSHLPDTNETKAFDGLTYKTEVIVNSLRSRSEIEWELGHPVNTCQPTPPGCVVVKIPRPKKITQSQFDGSQTFTRITKNDVFGEYNQVLETSEYGYGGETDLLRKTVTEYIKKGDAPSGDDQWRALPRLINLPTKTEVFDINGRIAYSKNEYDLNPIQPFSGAVPPSFCADSYCSSITERGDLSKTTTFENITTGSLSGELANNLVYDRAGNLVQQKPEITANTLNTSTYTPNTWYAYPEETTTSTDNINFPALSVKTTATYNLNTGLPLSVTDANQQTVEYKHNTDNWRLETTILPTGGTTSNLYDDLTRTYTQIAYTATNSIAGKQISKTNGLGLVSRQETFAKTENNQEISDVVEIQYDQFGRKKKVSNPFRSNESNTGIYWTEIFYDEIGREWKTKLPDGSETYTYFNETPRPQGASSNLGMTYRTKDPIGRERWYRTDSDGNAVEVIEPDPNGNGSVATNGLVTKYTFDKLKRLTQTEQGVQIRKFKYDSLGRLTRQKMAETQATLDDAGNYVGVGNGIWSEFYTYDKFSNVTSYKDARGVSTNYSYQNPAFPSYPIDPLNRLFSISYNTNGAANVLPAPTVNFIYQTSGNVSLLQSVTTAGVSTIDLGYDTRGRITEKKTTILSRPDDKITINYAYDSLNRMTDVFYPVQHEAGDVRKQVNYEFDPTGRTKALKVNNENYASDFNYNNFNQVTSLKIGPSGTNQITETYNYNAQTGLLENQKVIRGGNSLLDLSYEYQRCSCSTGGTGQITKIINNIDRNKDKAYEYDSLSRLKKVTGGVNKSWSQSYTYDRYGNRKTVSSLGVESLRDASSSIDGKESQNKLLEDSLPISSIPTVEKILSNVEKLKEVNKDGASPNNGKNENEQPDSENNNEERVNNSLSENASLYDKKHPGSDNLTSSGTPFDFDGDNKADVSIWNKSNGVWGVIKSSNNQTVLTQFGANGDQIAPGDYDNDGKTDIAVWRPSDGAWYILKSSNNSVYIQGWGTKGDSIMPADYDGDGKTDLAVFRPSTGYWYVLKSSDGGMISAQFGGQQYGDIPVAGDYDGDGKADIAVWRPTDGNWIILKSSNGQVQITHFGSSGDVPVQADYDNDDKDDIAVWTPSTGGWYILQSSNGQVAISTFGGQQFADMPVPADYDGDGKTDIAVWRSSTGYWFALKSSDGGLISNTLGASGNIAVPSAFRRRSSAPKDQNKQVPTDGIADLSYDETTNRINTTGFLYDAAGNQTQTKNAAGDILKYQYDAAGRLVKVKNVNNQTISTYTYGSSRERLITQNGDENSTNRTYYAWEGESVIAEFIDSATPNQLAWTKNYIFLGGKLLATQEKNGTGELLQFNHSDQLGTRLVTNPANGTSFEQSTLPFGTALESESSGAINRRFTSYDRSMATGLDYAVNRFYDSSQGRFTTVDPLKFKASNLMNPQTLNLYSYTANDPINRTDPDGQFWGIITGIFKFLFGGGTKFNFNFSIGNIPINFGFQGHLKNIYVGVAGFTVQVTGRNSVFNLFRNSQQTDNQTMFDDAVSAVKKILINPVSECRSFFGAGAYSAFENLIRNIEFDAMEDRNLGIQMNISVPAYTATQQIGVGLTIPLLNNDNFYLYFAPNRFVINTNGPFIRSGGAVRGMGGYQSGSLQIRVLQLLHELGHVTVTGFTKSGINKDLVKRGFLRGQLLLPQDGPNGKVSSVTNTNTVLKHCRTEIDAL